MFNEQACSEMHADLLSVVVPRALGSVAENIVQHICGVENIQRAAPPVAMMRQAILRHLHYQLLLLL